MISEINDVTEALKEHGKTLAFYRRDVDVLTEFIRPQSKIKSAPLHKCILGQEHIGRMSAIVQNITFENSVQKNSNRWWERHAFSKTKISCSFRKLCRSIWWRNRFLNISNNDEWEPYEASKNWRIRQMLQRPIFYFRIYNRCGKNLDTVGQYCYSWPPQAFFTDARRPSLFEAQCGVLGRSSGVWSYTYGNRWA